jgi:hypothetical protein
MTIVGMIEIVKCMLDFLKPQTYSGSAMRGQEEGDALSNDWHELTDLTGERPFVVTSVRLSNGVTIDGEFELPPLARLRYEDQVFVSEFVRSHGSIKDMEKAFGISYPTVKNRLNRIADQLQLVEVAVQATRPSGPLANDVLAELERGEITAEQAAERLRQ